ncbi:cell cycle transcriptional repressor Whi5 [Schizosaccharomyces japonicus yFS275]|uniref:Cell cycle transcriptional repressor Whi5 n=1 Tax=Schizosaccharomyces japonicus (strain yFS275 / FY16936) TaxID=402676 RepID=B6K576_SCHJY|nr:cell cycle transcriptional repressor Whi5 [Schizosaccharomyces japonicus yFS275]EEB08680.1 cell cycle transcriptional repressor Whi5 [Schizosaccharomyces japonicus yFS275]
MHENKTKTSSLPLTSNQQRNLLEISRNLKERLQYAAFKVDNGWETRSLDQVEVLVQMKLQSVQAGNRLKSILKQPKTIRDSIAEGEPRSDTVLHVQVRGDGNAKLDTLSPNFPTLLHPQKHVSFSETDDTDIARLLLEMCASPGPEPVAMPDQPAN